MAGALLVTREDKLEVLGFVDRVKDGEDGFVLPIRDAEAIADCLQRLSDDPERLTQMSRAASARHAEFTLEGYQNRLLAVLRQHLEAPA